MFDTNPPSPAPPVAGSTAKKSVKVPRKRRGGFLNLILLIGIIIAISLFVWAEQQRREAQDKLTQTATELEELRKSAQASGQEVADKVLAKLRTHMDIPNDPAPTVATIVDAAALKEANEFYTPAENGHHLIITGKRAILYDPKRDIILDVVPVQVDPNATPLPSASPTTGGASPTTSPATGGAGSPSPSPAASFTPSPSPSR
jgi:type II secretory pathway pseudopilin PulG